MQNVLTLLVSPEPLTRLGLRHLVAQEVRVARFVEAETPAEALRQQGAQRPVVAIIAADPSQMDVPQLLVDLRRRQPALALMVVTHDASASHVAACIASGAGGYVTFTDPESELKMAFVSVLRGDVHVSRCAARGMQAGFRAARGQSLPRPADLDAKLAHLSTREREVFDLHGCGCGCKEISQKLGVSIKTVETHQKRCREKLGVSCSAELRKMARDHAPSAMPDLVPA